MESSTITYFCVITLQWPTRQGIMTTWTGAITAKVEPGTTRETLFHQVKEYAFSQGVDRDANVMFLSIEPNELVPAVTA